MELIRTGFDGLLVIKPDVFEDSRGYFYESFNKERFRKSGIIADFVQDNQSLSSRGIIRGLHYQLQPFAQSKLVRAIEGIIYDVAVDIRKGSPTFLKWFGVELSGTNKLQLFIPKGFAHGFSVLSEKAVVLYKTDDYYKKEAERGILFNDPKLGINWQIDESEVKVSERDRNLPTLENAENNFMF